MKITKRLTKIVEGMVSLSFDKDGNQLDARAKKFASQLAELPSYQAIPALSLFVSRLKTENNKSLVTVESASALSKEDLKLVENIVAKKISKFQLETKINPSILGGLKVKIGDIVYDGSARGKIEQIREAISNT